MLIRVIDLETTGFPPDAEVVEIAAVDVRAEPFHAPIVRVPAEIGRHPLQDYIGLYPLHDLVRPARPIPPQASAIHHIIDGDVAGSASWDQVVPSYVGPEVDVYAAHNCEFERAFITAALTAGRPWICTYKCALRLWPDAPGHGNQVLRYWLAPRGLDRAIAREAHRALPDAYVTAHLLARMLEETPTEQLIAWSAEPALLARVPFGRSKGARWSEVDDGFLYWVLDRDFDASVHFTARTEIERRRQDAEQAEA